MRRLRHACALATVALAGCQLIDQRTFEGRGTGPDAAQLARPAAATRGTPLITLFPGDLQHDWPDDLRAAVRDALTRHPDAAFDIVTPVPTGLGPQAQLAATQAGSADAAAAADIIAAEGVPPERLFLGARGDPGRPGREVLIFLR